MLSLAALICNHQPAIRVRTLHLQKPVKSTLGRMVWLMHATRLIGWQLPGRPLPQRLLRRRRQSPRTCCVQGLPSYIARFSFRQ